MSLNNRILIGSPCYGKVDPEILDDWMRFAYHCGRRMPEYEFCIGIKSKAEQFRARNMIVEGAQQHNCDRILMIDDDMVIDARNEGSRAYEFLSKLLEHDKDICGILYYQRGGECQPVTMTKLGDSGYRFLRDDEIEGGLQKVDVAGGGCLLIKTRIFDRIPFPYFEPEHKYGTDVQLCRQAAAKGIEVWADTSIEFGHLRNEKVLVTSANRHQFQDAAQNGIVTKFVTADVYSRLILDAMEYTGRLSEEAMWHEANAFMDLRKDSGLSDPDWYREFPKERVCRQVWFNTQNSIKKMMTKYILSSIAHHRPLRILDFGCGIGLTAFTLAEKGHQVAAMDIRGTGTLEFLKWRMARHGVDLSVVESEGGIPLLTEDYDVIIAMDSIEHISEWKQVIAALSKHLRPEGVLFSNNGILEDFQHAEHYPVYPKLFIAECLDNDLMPLSQVSYVKRSSSLTETKTNEEVLSHG